jgi:CheY-like chemotaxis protein
MSEPITHAVLVVDDYPEVLTWATRSFRKEAWRVITAADEAEARTRIIEQRDAGTHVQLLLTELDVPAHRMTTGTPAE